MLKPRPAALSAPRYQPASRLVPDPDRAIYVDANESPLGPPAAARDVAAAAAFAPARYPDGGALALRQAIANQIGADPGAIVCGHGSEELIHLTCRALLEPGDEVIVGRTGFAIYRIAAIAAGARVIQADEHDYALDPQSVLGALSERTRIVFVANPNNPTGALMSPGSVEQLRRAIPPHVLLVLDAAYAEYVTAPGYTAGHEWVRADGNLAVMRTFSKAYGMASLRLGWMHAPLALVDALDRVRPVFNVSGVAQAAGTAALGASDHLARLADHTRASLDLYAPLARRLEGRVILGHTNFVFVEKAAGLAAHLLARNVVPFGLKGYGMADAVRISFGSQDENAEVIAGVESWLAG